MDEIVPEHAPKLLRDQVDKWLEIASSTPPTAELFGVAALVSDVPEFRLIAPFGGGESQDFRLLHVDPEGPVEPHIHAQMGKLFGDCLPLHEQRRWRRICSAALQTRRPQFHEFMQNEHSAPLRAGYTLILPLADADGVYCQLAAFCTCRVQPVGERTAVT